MSGLSTTQVFRHKRRNCKAIGRVEVDYVRQVRDEGSQRDRPEECGRPSSCYSISESAELIRMATKNLEEHCNATFSGDPERIAPGGPDWDAAYPDHIQRYEFAMRIIKPGSKILDAGCGAGYGAAYMADRGAGLVVAVDISDEALALGRTHFDRKSITWLQDDCHTLQKAGELAPFDAVCNLENIEHLPEPEKFLGRLTQLLRPDGVFITSTPNRFLMNKLRGEAPDAPSKNKYHFREYTSTELMDLLQKFFSQVRLAYQRPVLATRVTLALYPFLNLTWTNPAMRLGRFIQRVLRRPNIPASLNEALPPREWEILDQDPGALETWHFIAVCSHAERDA
jgi:2-polyprenyl-3-methyl-5-hydroxy-6-metoxy-1,4-benzoquinol methylase